MQERKAPANVKKLKHSEIIIGIEGWLITVGRKQKSLAFPCYRQFCLTSIDINTHYQGKDQVLPLQSSQRMNTYLEGTADVFEVHKKLPNHIVRDFFATTITVTNGDRKAEIKNRFFTLKNWSN